MSEQQYLIGIDLGTTNCTMSYRALEGEDEISLADIPQIVEAGTEDARSSLPSFIYLPSQEEIDSGSLAPSWASERTQCVGLHARERGAEVANRLVSSAKSWLCHGGIDRRQPILPQNAAEDVVALSPVGACAQYLQHLKEVWDQAHEEAPFEQQQVLVTVPASFDPAARQLVQEAAEIAGYPDVILMEEPQAAFYAWLDKQGDSWREQLQVGDTVLVVDIGGGTTDFSLIKAVDHDGDLTLERIAVGSHLLLGGDNMDLALAYTVRAKLEEQGHDIDDWQMQALVHRCRVAKEQLLGESPPDAVDITIAGRGSGLIGGSVSATLQLDEVQAVLVDGFAPMTSYEERAEPQQRSGLQQVGLPYASDPRISTQLARFLARGENEFTVPTAVLFNGGTTKSAALRDRLVELLNSWAEQCEAASVKVLEGADHDNAVSRGAVVYGLAREGKAIRIKGGTSHSYYIGIEGAAPAVPGIPPPLQAICIAPFGMEEGTEEALPGQQFALVVGERATFRFFSYHQNELPDGTEAASGAVVRKWKDWLEELDPIETVLDAEETVGRTVCVQLKAKVTELGVLELWCIGEGDKSWKLEFELRQEVVGVGG